MPFRFEAEVIAVECPLHLKVSISGRDNVEGYWYRFQKIAKRVCGPLLAASKARAADPARDVRWPMC
jgi:hypothetical protein